MMIDQEYVESLHAKITYSDGRKYEGELKDGKYHGKGTLTYSKTYSNGEKTYLYGYKYVGEFKDNKYH